MIRNISVSDAALPRRVSVLSLVTAVLLAAMTWMALPGTAAAGPLFSAIAVDASNGKVLFQHHCDGHRYPASLTKVMTLYLLFEDLRAGKVTLSTRFTISRHAAAQQPTKLGLKPGSTISVRDAIGAIVTKSANDIAVAVAEGLGGSEKAFAQRMTRTAHELGMTRTHFDNASGLPDRLQRTTARDMATLALRIQRDFPKRFAWFSTVHFTYDGRTYRNHNHLLGRLKGVDGIKTGYTRASGFNLIATIERGGKRVVGVVMGGRTSRSRNAYMRRMLERMFRSRKLEPYHIAALVAGHPPGYVPRRVALAISVSTPPLPQPKPEAAWNKDARPKVVEAVLGNDSARQEAKPAEPATSRVQPTTFQSVTVRAETFGKSDSLAPAVTGKIGDDARLTSEKALAKTEATDQPPQQPARQDTWNIQVGAFPTPQGARQRIDTALATGVKVLDGKSAFTMKAEAGSATIYRARFSGFDEKAAREACKLLKRKGLGCFTLAPAANSG